MVINLFFFEEGKTNFWGIIFVNIWKTVSSLVALSENNVATIEWKTS